MSTIQRTDNIRTLLRRELLRLARIEEDLAATEAAAVPYWANYPPTVAGHRTAAAVLRENADRLLPATASSVVESR